MIRFLASPFALLLVLSVHGAVGCATVSPFNQDFVEVRTPRFEILSSFGTEATLELARSLEFHHAGTLRALGLEEREGRPVRVRVLAFDDRGFSRPFSLRGEDALFVPGPDRALLVLRASPDWRARASEDLRHRYAHWLIRRLSPTRRPLWLEEGMAQYASSVALRDGNIRIGVPPSGHLPRLLEWQVNDFADVLETRDLSAHSVKQRADFDARAWALVHWLAQPGANRRSGKTALAELLEAIDRTPGRDPILSMVGQDSLGLGRTVNGYFRARAFRVAWVRPAGWDEAQLRPRPIQSARARTALAELALALGRPEVARAYFERALEADPSSARALVGLAMAASPRDEAVRQLAAEVRDGRVAVDPEMLVRFGRVFAREEGQPGVVSGGAAAEGRDESARWFFTEALTREPGSVTARLELARLETSSRGGDGRTAALRWIAEARRLEPGSLAIDVVEARLRAAECRVSGARSLLRDVLSRGHWKPLRDEARSLLDALERDC